MPTVVLGDQWVSDGAYWCLRESTGAYWSLKVPNGA